MIEKQNPLNRNVRYNPLSRNVVERLIRLKENLGINNLDAILVGSSSNRRYLSGFTGSDGWLFITPTKSFIAVDFRYVVQTKEQCTDLELFNIKGDVFAWLPELLKQSQIKRLGVESDHLSLSTFQSICKSAQIFDNRIQVIPVKAVVESLRVTKENIELEFIKKAADIADKAMFFARSHLRIGVTEKQLAWQLESYMRQNESEAIPFEIIVASGVNSALPHAQPTDKKIAAGEPVTIDLGARYNGYCSDITRTYIIGKHDAKFDTIYNNVLSAQLSGLSVIESGMPCKKADELIRGMIDKAGYGEYFGHGSGHGVGIDVHEPPRLSTMSDDILGDGMVFTVEPGIYIPGWGGVRIEDTVTLEKGKVICLTRSSKEALIQGG